MSDLSVMDMLDEYASETGIDAEDVFKKKEEPKKKIQPKKEKKNENNRSKYQSGSCK